VTSLPLNGKPEIMTTTVTLWMAILEQSTLSSPLQCAITASLMWYASSMFTWGLESSTAESAIKWGLVCETQLG
jgi:hypothetical protein